MGGKRLRDLELKDCLEHSALLMSILLLVWTCVLCSSLAVGVNAYVEEMNCGKIFAADPQTLRLEEIQPVRSGIASEQVMVLTMTAVHYSAKPETSSGIAAEKPVEEKVVEVGEMLEIPEGRTDVKTYMSYKTITAKSSKQWAMQQHAETDENGLRRIDGMYMIALGTYYAKQCGEMFRITLDTGHQFIAVTGDIKRDCDTDENNQRRNDNNIVEFIVDTDYMDPMARTMGDVSFTEGANLSGGIQSIEYLGTYSMPEN